MGRIPDVVWATLLGGRTPSEIKHGLFFDSSKLAAALAAGQYIDVCLDNGVGPRMPTLAEIHQLRFPEGLEAGGLRAFVHDKIREHNAFERYVPDKDGMKKQTDKLKYTRRWPWSFDCKVAFSSMHANDISVALSVLSDHHLSRLIDVMCRCIIFGVTERMQRAVHQPCLAHFWGILSCTSEILASVRPSSR
jgi:hypothetical protein